MAVIHHSTPRQPWGKPRTPKRYLHPHGIAEVSAAYKDYFAATKRLVDGK